MMINLTYPIIILCIIMLGRSGLLDNKPNLSYHKCIIMVGRLGLYDDKPDLSHHNPMYHYGR